ncbi:17.1 kDa class II heat shock protein-like [Papaver somniferum]|uniref:17.1 kDa class II heat shock protein-like n=1 Tax=Papaver somniferum TaxID=3469 RepID=UPI000E6FFD95|nr:17.1 kDa class II heat shock protein-like [Papaver somniferum]
MATAPTEMVNSYVFLIDLSGKEMSNDEIKVKVEGDRTLIVSYLSSVYGPVGISFFWQTKKFDLPKYANLDAISAISHNETLFVTVNKVNRVMTERTIKVTKVEI